MTNLGMHFSTTADRSGMDQVNAGLQTTSTNYTGLLSKMERPLGRVAFATMASDLMGVQTAGRTATESLALGLKSVGMALMFVGGPISIVAIALTGMLAIYERVTAARKQTADVVSKEIDANTKAAASHRDAAKLLLEKGIITKEDQKILLDDAKANDEAVTSLQAKLVKEREGLALKLQNIEASKKQRETEQATNSMSGGAMLSLLMDEKKIQDAKKQTVEAMEGLAPRIQAMEDAKKKAEDDVTAQLSKNEAERAALLQKEASEISRYTTMFASAWTDTDKKIIFETGKFAAAIIQKFADMFASQLEMQAAADFYSGNILGGALATAGAAAVRAIGSAAGAAVQGGGGSTAATSTASEASVSAGAMTGPGAGTQGQGSTLTINIQGSSVIDPSTVALLVRGINQHVTQLGGSLVATQVITNGPVPAGVSL